MSVDVKVACPCPGTPHTEDTISLREKLPLLGGIAVQGLVVDALRAARERRSDAPNLNGKLAEGYLLNGIEAWTLVDELGSGIPVNEATIRTRLLSDFAVSAPIADVADDLYMEAVIRPLVTKAQTLLRNGQTNGSTSPPRSGTSKRQKRSKPSSTTTTPTASTAETSPAPAGVSRS